jgi:hypothetical protein
MRTDMMKLIIVFRNFSKAPKSGKTYSKNMDFNELGTTALKITFLHGVESFLTGRSVYLTTLSVAKIT